VWLTKLRSRAVEASATYEAIPGRPITGALTTIGQCLFYRRVGRAIHYRRAQRLIRGRRCRPNGIARAQTVDQLEVPAEAR
jgi:hypothetical protein